MPWSGSTTAIEDAGADKGSHSNEFLAWCGEYGVRAYIPERAKSVAHKRTAYGNRCRVKGKRGPPLIRARPVLFAEAPPEGINTPSADR